MNKKLFFVVSSIIFLSPVIALAEGFNAGERPATNIGASTAYILKVLGGVFDVIWIAFIAFAIIMFIVAGFQFLASQGEPEGFGKARKAVIWGVIGVIVGVAAFVLPFIIRRELFL